MNYNTIDTVRVKVQWVSERVVSKFDDIIINF